MKPMSNIRQDALKLAAEVGIDPRTAERWLKQERATLSQTAYALKLAAEKLGMDLSAYPVGN